MSFVQLAKKYLRSVPSLKMWVDILGVAVAVGFFFYYAPPEIWNDQPATGGDTGSHFWPLKTLVEQALPQGHIKVWNPGNLGGEPHLVHYFPLPYLLMAFLSLFVPLGLAFNIGTFLPLLLFPVCVYICFRNLKTSFPIPVLATIGSLSYAYNESFSMWGGNSLSLLAGQFAHMYAVDFFLLLIGALSLELSKDRLPWRSILLTAAVFLSHFYVALLMPIVFLVFVFAAPKTNWWPRFKKLLGIGLLGLGLSLWFVIPMLDNAKWTTPFALVWYSQNIWKEIFPPIFYPFFVVLGISAIYFLIRAFRRGLPDKEWRLDIPLWIVLILTSTALYYIFPRLGLVDIRALPSLQMAVVFLAMIGLGLMLRRALDIFSVLFIVPFLVGLGIYWTDLQVKNFPHWLKWNYSSWDKKPAYPDLMNLSAMLRGTFSDSRVIYENNDQYNSAGTMRVFEMLPYFANRSTLESVYMQATILAPEAFYLQAAISKGPSCPFPNFPCTGYNLEAHRDHFSLMGVGQMILSTEPVLEQAKKASWLESQGTYGMWHLYQLKDPFSYVSYLTQKPHVIEADQFKENFYQWFKAYNKESPYLLVKGFGDLSPEILGPSMMEQNECRSQVRAEFDRIQLSTNCPGKFHILKFAFHSSWRSLTGEDTYLVSPGFIGLIPKRTQVTLLFGQSVLWSFSVLVSWLLFIYFLMVLAIEIKRSRCRSL